MDDAVKPPWMGSRRLPSSVCPLRLQRGGAQLSYTDSLATVESDFSSSQRMALPRAWSRFCT